jgi:hypothetical protein
MLRQAYVDCSAVSVTDDAISMTDAVSRSMTSAIFTANGGA